jgi:hypothetical protein
MNEDEIKFFAEDDLPDFKGDPRCEKCLLSPCYAVSADVCAVTTGEW